MNKTFPCYNLWHNSRHKTSNILHMLRKKMVALDVYFCKKLIYLKTNFLAFGEMGNEKKDKNIRVCHGIRLKSSAVPFCKKDPCLQCIQFYWELLLWVFHLKQQLLHNIAFSTDLLTRIAVIQSQTYLLTIDWTMY